MTPQSPIMHYSGSRGPGPVCTSERALMAVDYYEWLAGNGWTTIRDDVTCPKCMKHRDFITGARQKYMPAGRQFGLRGFGFPVGERVEWTETDGRQRQGRVRSVAWSTGEPGETWDVEADDGAPVGHSPPSRFRLLQYGQLGLGL